MRVKKTSLFMFKRGVVTKQVRRLETLDALSKFSNENIHILTRFDQHPLIINNAVENDEEK